MSDLDGTVFYTIGVTIEKLFRVVGLEKYIDINININKLTPQDHQQTIL
jgi:hypothetical protein